MSEIHVYYRASDGEIGGHENTVTPATLPGLEVTTVDVGDRVPDPKLHKIDLTTHQMIDKSDAEKKAALVPDSVEVSSAIARELFGTDGMMATDRPLAEASRASWASYRQSLRDLSKLSGPVAMVKAWPLRPDGNDAAATLRANVTASEG